MKTAYPVLGRDETSSNSVSENAGLDADCSFSILLFRIPMKYVFTAIDHNLLVMGHDEGIIMDVRGGPAFNPII